MRVAQPEDTEQNQGFLAICRAVENRADADRSSFAPAQNRPAVPVPALSLKTAVPAERNSFRVFAEVRRRLSASRVILTVRRTILHRGVPCCLPTRCPG